LIQFACKTFVVLGQKLVSGNGDGWPEPHKFALFYEKMLGNCPYRQFFDTTSLCDPANAESVRHLSELRDQEAASFFEETFCGPHSQRRSITCQKNLSRSFENKTGQFKQRNSNNQLPFHNSEKDFLKLSVPRFFCKEK
jgi:hypothetical protein